MKSLGLGIAATLFLATAPALAADLVVDVPAIEMATSNWDGAYAGFGASAYAGTLSRGVNIAGIIGANKTIGENGLVGGELYVAPGIDNGLGLFVVLGAEARGGFLVNDTALIYGAAGIEGDSFGSIFGTLGGGVEFAMTDDLSLDIEYKHQFGLNTATQLNQLGASLNWHF